MVPVHHVNSPLEFVIVMAFYGIIYVVATLYNKRKKARSKKAKSKGYWIGFAVAVGISLATMLVLDVTSGVEGEARDIAQMTIDYLQAVEDGDAQKAAALSNRPAKYYREVFKNADYTKNEIMLPPEEEVEIQLGDTKAFLRKAPDSTGAEGQESAKPNGSWKDGILVRTATIKMTTNADITYANGGWGGGIHEFTVTLKKRWNGNWVIDPTPWEGQFGVAFSK